MVFVLSWAVVATVVIMAVVGGVFMEVVVADS